MLVVLVSVLLTERFNVAIESQPAVLVNVTENVPAALYVCAFQLYGNWFEQMVVLVVLVSVLLTERFNVATESQPALLVNVTEYVPAALYVCAFQLYGNWFEQMVVFVMLLITGFTVKLSVATESHPAELVNVTV